MLELFDSDVSFGHEQLCVEVFKLAYSCKGIVWLENTPMLPLHSKTLRNLHPKYIHSNLFPSHRLLDCTLR